MWHKHCGIVVSFCALAFSGLWPATAADWPQFRGFDSTGVADDVNVPVDIGANVAWAADLPGRGISGPIVVRGKVFVTASSGIQQDRLHVLCFDARTSHKLWERQFWATGRTLCHPKMANATPTPASDGERVFAFFSSNDVICLDLEGNLQWFRGLTHDYPNASNSLGMSSSLVVSGETLVVQVENLSESFTAGLDVKAGVNRWKLDRPVLDNWTSPALLRGKTVDEDLVIVQSVEGLVALRPYTGFEVWSFNEACSSIPSTGVTGGKLLVPSKGLTALAPKVENGPPEVLWNANRLGPGTSSPIGFGNQVFTIGGSGVLSCADVKTGESLWQVRLQVPLGDKTARGVYSATPVAANGHIYLVNEDGVAIVVSAGEQGSVVATHEFGEPIMGTPAIADGSIYFRSDKHLWKVGAK